MPQIETILKARIPIVSTTEELSYPVGKNRALARKIDALAKKDKVAVLGTGVFEPAFRRLARPRLRPSSSETTNLACPR